jgi:hypothetical protein
VTSSVRCSPFPLAALLSPSSIPRGLFIAMVALVVSAAPGWGQFQSPTSISLGFSSGMQASADFNGDGKPDLAIYNPSGGSVSILLSNGDGTFQNRVTIPVASAGAVGIVVRTGDFNGDGKQDLLVAGTIFRGNGDGTFGGGIQLPVQSVGFPVTSDFNRDGKTDIAFAHTANCSNSRSCSVALTVVLSQASGSFQQLPDLVTQESWQSYGSLVAGDFNRDGKLDLAVPVFASGVSGVDMSVVVFWGKGDGTFQPQIESGLGAWAGNQMVAGDFNGDGITDLAWLVQEGTLNFQQVSPAQAAVMMSNGDGTFKAPVFSTFNTLSYVDSLVSADFEGDGKSDLALVSRPYGPPQVVNLLFSAGDGTFHGPSSVTINATSTGSPTFELHDASVGDFNGDGRIDLAIPMPEYYTEAILLNSLPRRDFSVAAEAGGSASQTVTAGQTASYSLALTPSNGFTGTVALTCSGAPAAASCAVNPSSVNVNGTVTTPFNVSVSTTARTSAASVLPMPRGLIGWTLVLLAGLSSAWFAARRRRFIAALGSLSVVVLGLLIGCGGGSTPIKSPVQTGTPAGTYTVVVSATSGSTTHTQNLTLVVQ